MCTFNPPSKTILAVEMEVFLIAYAARSSCQICETKEEEEERECAQFAGLA